MLATFTLHNILIVLYMDIMSTKMFSRILSWVKLFVVKSKKRMLTTLLLALKIAGTGTEGHQQAEIEILHCHVVEYKNLC